MLGESRPRLGLRYNSGPTHRKLTSRSLGGVYPVPSPEAAFLHMPSCESPYGQPLGGYKQSGFGREPGMHTIEHYPEFETALAKNGLSYER